jgi:site-specific DNA-cytosine methylase
MPDKDNFQAVIQPTIIDRAAFNQGENAQYEPKIEESETMPSLIARGPHAVAQPIAVDTFNQTTNEHTTQTLGSSATDVNHYGAVINPPMAIRRLTPVECERLQGFPDNWTKTPWKKKPAEDCPDGPRYKACGNSMAVPCMKWLGQRIQKAQDKKTDHL